MQVPGESLPAHPAVPASNPASGNPTASAAFIAAKRFFPSASKFMSGILPSLSFPSKPFCQCLAD
jgi:hypothetical protein